MAKRDPNRFQVYVIEIGTQWCDVVAPGLPEGKRCFYVGQTGERLTDRYKEHRTGRPFKKGRLIQPGKVFKRIREENGGETLRRNVDTFLLRSMTREYGTMSKAESEQLEEALIVYLRQNGHAVYPDGGAKDLIPFDTYLQS